MPPYTLFSIAIAGTPTAWAAVALLILVIFAPRILPMLARVAAQLMQREVRRRLGVPEPGPRNPPPRPRVTVEVMPPTPPPSHSRTPDPEIIEAEIVPPRKRNAALWWAAAVSLALLAVLSWILFHPR